jgi:8-oxo-dGTP pyrophosphatase MutT (NUDIX family)
MRFVQCGQHVHWGPYGAAGLFLRCGDHVLLQQRSQRVHHGGTWSIPGGALERDEDPVDAALREAEEETGVDTDKVDVLDEIDAWCGDWVFTTVIGTADTQLPVRRSWEGSARWVPFAELSQLPLHPAFAETVMEAARATDGWLIHG